MKTVRSQPRRGMTVVASHFNGWYKGTVEKRAFRYATASDPSRVPTARLLHSPSHWNGWLPMSDAYGIPAIEMAGYHCLMPTASAMQNLKLESNKSNETVCD